MKSYRPNIEAQKRRYSLRKTLARIRRSQRPSHVRLAPNAEPWLVNPRSLADAEFIADEVQRAADGWQA